MVYTDGSKTTLGTGAGVFSEDLNINIALPLSAYNTVFQAECVGIITAIKALETRKVSGQSVRILSDSKSVLQALNGNCTTSSLIQECHQDLNKVGAHNKITIQWIKGHSESRGNDAADELARRGSDMQPVGPEPIFPIPASWFVGKIREHTINEHQTLWQNLDTCRQAKLAVPRVNARLAKALLQLSRTKLRLLTGAITGHGLFNKHLFTIGVTDSPLCRGCMGAEETAAHVVLECSGVANYRAKFLGSLESLQEAVAKAKALGDFLAELGWLE